MSASTFAHYDSSSSIVPNHPSMSGRGKYYVVVQDKICYSSADGTLPTAFELLQASYRCKMNGSLVKGKQTKDDWCLKKCTCKPAVPLFLRLRLHEATKTITLLISMKPTKKKAYERTSFFNNHFVPKITAPLVGNHDATVILLKQLIHDFISRQSVLPEAEAVLEYLLLTEDGRYHGTIHILQMENVRSLITNEIARVLSNVASRNAESDMETDVFTSNVQGLAEFRNKKSIEPFIDRFLNCSNPHPPTLDQQCSLNEFTSYFGFSSAKELHTLPLE